MANFVTLIGTLLVVLLVALACLAVFPDGAGALLCILPIAFAITLPLMRRFVRAASPIPNRVARLIADAVAFVRMDVQKVEGYRRYLDNSVPLIGGRFRHRAAEALALDGSAGAIELLAEALTRGGDQRVRRIALAALRQATDWRAISAACEVWAATRHSDLTTLLVQQEWVASIPAEARVLTALKVGELDVIAKGKANIVEPLVEACSDTDPVIAERAWQVIRRLEDEESKEAMCRMALEQGNPVAYDVVIEAEYLPQDERLRALFFFMSEQWERYDLLDFERHLLRMAYAAADGPLKQRIREKLRATGRTDFLSIVAGEDFRDRITKMASSEIELLVQTLATNREWAKLWELAFEVSFVRSVRIVDTLARNTWSPERDDDKAIFLELTSLAQQGLLMNEEEVRQLFRSTLLRSHIDTSALLPPALLRAQAKVPGRINDVAFSPTRPVIAVGTGRRKVVLWNYRRAERERVLGGLGHSIGHVAFTGDGTLVCGERTNRTNVPCGIYVWDGDGQQFRLGQHTGSVTVLEPVGESQMLSAGRDGKVVLWDVPARRITRDRTFGSPVRAVCVSPDSRRVALRRDRGMDQVTLPGLDNRGSNYWGPAAARCLAYSSSGDELVVGKSNGDIAIYEPGKSYTWQNIETTWMQQHGQALTHHDARIRDVTVLHNQGVVVSAAYDGSIHFVSLDRFVSFGERAFIGRVQAPLGRVTSLHISPDESFMAVGSSEAELSLWDLRTLGVQGLLVRPFAEATVSILPVFDALAESQELSPRAQMVLKYTECALRHRFRFDIEIGDAPTIMMGEFDIEIEG
jgi:WD40 repeat protein